MKNIIILLILICTVGNAQIEDFFKYSTFYTSVQTNTSFVEKEDYIAIDKGYENVTEVNPYDYNLTIGLRKISRFDYAILYFCFSLLLYVIAVKNLLIKISGLDTWDLSA